MIMFPRIQCNDGFTMSVQARKFCYCSPRDSVGPWTAVEVGFPSEREDMLMEYLDGDINTPDKSVYGWVPVETVEDIVAKRGGTNAEGIAVLNAIRSAGGFLDRFRE